ncbi:MAG: hypothetical protein F6K26_08455 [Moorea sp. SIO2I5]|nr:hypothetical protein [Moorena sp. SIO2I5]
MRYTGFFPVSCSLLPAPYSLLPVPCSLFPVPFAIQVCYQEFYPNYNHVI